MSSRLSLLLERLSLSRRELLFGVGVTMAGITALLLLFFRTSPPQKPPLFSGSFPHEGDVKVRFTGTPPIIPQKVRLYELQAIPDTSASFQAIVQKLNLQPAPYSLRGGLYTNADSSITLSAVEGEDTFLYADSNAQIKDINETLTIEQAEAFARSFLENLGLSVEKYTLDKSFSRAGNIDPEEISHIENSDLGAIDANTNVNTVTLAYQQVIDSLPVSPGLGGSPALTLNVSSQGVFRAEIPLTEVVISETTQQTYEPLSFQDILLSVGKGNFTVIGSPILSQPGTPKFTELTLDTAIPQYRINKEEKRLIPVLYLGGTALLNDGTESPIALFTPLYATTPAQP